MKLKRSMEYYETDQGIQDGELVLVWAATLFENSLTLKKYQKFDKMHYAGGMVWKFACRVTEPIELDQGEVAPEPVKEDSSDYRDVWVRAYALAGAPTADSALAEFKLREKSGDFKK